MKKTVKVAAAVAAAVALAALVLHFVCARPGAAGRAASGEVRDAEERASARAAADEDGRAPETADAEGDAVPDAAADADDEGDTDDADAMEASSGETEEDRLAAEEEKRVDAFDDMTDKFREVVEDAKPVSLDQVKQFHELFRQIPKARKEECLQRALNLVPDENVMLLAGILMDKEEDKELVTLVFNDILNRDDSVKQVLLKEIYRDRSHPCWTDAAWVLDATGETPGAASEPSAAEPSAPAESEDTADGDAQD